MRYGIDETTGERTWKVKMPVDYGYIKRTKGADGDQINGSTGKSGKKFFVIDQLDAVTGAFDEHKVMLRFKDEAAARAAYEGSFSDGKGKARLGNIHEVSVDELKAWLDTDDHQRSHVEHLIDRDLSDANFDVPEGPRRRIIPAEKLLDQLDFGLLTGVNRVLAPFFKSKLKKLAEGTDVEFVSKARMAELAPDTPNAIGMHIRDGDDVFKPSKVYVLDTVEPGGGAGQLGHVVLHELTHAVTVREMAANPKFVAKIDKLRKAFEAHYHQNFDAMNAAMPEHLQGALKYSMLNPTEFIAETFSNKYVQEALARIPLDPKLARELGLQNQRASVWDGVKALVKQAVERFTGRVQNFDTMLDGVMRVSEQLTDLHERSTMPRIREYRQQDIADRGRVTPERMVEREALVPSTTLPGR